MIQALIFDMDGTIVDNMHVHTAVWLELLADYGVTMTPLQFQATTAGNTNSQLLRTLINPQMSDAEVAAIAHEKEVRYREQFRPFLQPVAGLEPLLQQAQQANVTLAVATAANQPNIEYVLDGLNLRHYFATVVGAEDVAHGKPEPDLFLLVAERLNLAPETCLVFEDSLAGLEAAHRAGMQAVAVTTSHAPEEMLHLPSVRQAIADFTEFQLADYINS
ncbi:MAG: HAD family phosphatase [Ardenticatenaceae bacterium]|nr:HAD family phosphatase [Anaerolineales bacterium]MCB8976478.1 HAD family phosphatase [Ardenticatenaceae bacterium]